MYFIKNNIKIPVGNILALLVFFLFLSVGLLSTRSIWVDEARLLVNIYLVNFQDLFHPLPYYDQASPLIPLLITKGITLIAGTNLYILRALTFVVSFAFVLPLVFWLIKKRNISYLTWFMLIYLMLLNSTVFYSTEIKHYGFEMAGVFLFLYWFLVYCEDTKTALSIRYIWIPAFAVYVGFSTVLLIPAFFTFVLLNTLMSKNIERDLMIEVFKAHLVIAMLLIVVGLLTYFQMKQLTVFQIGNNWSKEVYANKGLVQDVKLFIQCFQVFSRPFLIFASISSVCALFMDRNSLAFKLNVFLIIVVGISFVLKLVGLYPIRYGRHILWILPISALATTFVMPALFESKNATHHKIFMMLATILILAVVWNFYEVIKCDNRELENNKTLFSELSKQPESDVLVFRETEPLVDMFRIINPMSHHFYGVSKSERFSSKKGRLNEQSYNDWQYKQLPQHQSFLTIISHSDAIEAEPANDKIKALRTTFKNYRCSFVSIYKGLKVQLLRVSCK